MPHRQPDAALHDPRPEYLRALIEQSGLSQRQAAERIGISERLMRYYLVAAGHDSYRAAPYPVQFALEHLADN
ncbi:XRE family transcriptional regulator [Xanthomonas campestris pv. armoraciae]